MNLGMNWDKAARRTMEVNPPIVLLSPRFVPITYPSHLRKHQKNTATRQIQVEDNPGTCILAVG